MNYLKQNHLSILIIVFLIVSALIPKASNTVSVDGFGSINNATSTITNPFVLKQGLAVGTTTTVTRITGLIAGTCNLIGSDAVLAATTSKAYDCSVTGLTNQYKILAQLASTTVATTTSIGWEIMSADASTTDGYAT